MSRLPLIQRFHAWEAAAAPLIPSSGVSGECLMLVVFGARTRIGRATASRPYGDNIPMSRDTSFG